MKTPKKTLDKKLAKKNKIVFNAQDLPTNKKGLINGLNILTNDMKVQMGLMNDNVKASMSFQTILKFSKK
jgi:hypothetical protein